MVLEKTHQLVLKNDDEHDFFYVIACLIKFCDHSRDQAEQCAIITHNVGSCNIKTGDFLGLLSIQDELMDVGLKVELSDYENSNMYK